MGFDVKANQYGTEDQAKKAKKLRANSVLLVREIPIPIAAVSAMRCHAISVVLCLAHLWDVSTASRILFLPMNHGSNVHFFAMTAARLQEAGHSVTVLTASRNRRSLEKMGVPTLTFESPTLQSKEFEDDMHSAAFEGGMVKFFKLFSNISAAIREETELILGNATLMHQLETGGYDLALVTGIEMARTLYIIPYRLGIPYITLTARHNPWKSGVPALPSVEPVQLVLPFTEDSTIFERLRNFLLFLMMEVLIRPSWADEALIPGHTPGRAPTTLDTLYKRSEMWLINMETICLDWPRVHGFHYQFISCLNCKDAEQLPDDLEEFAGGAREGLIVVTFGSALKKIPRDIMEKMLTAFGSMEQRVIMRYDGVDLSELVPPNVKLMKWLPQNDLLGHPNTKLFITHAGANGQHEALHHGIPMLSLPIVSDGYYNAARSTKHGYGLTLDIRTFTSSELEESTREIIGNPEYATKIKACSERMRSMPTPKEKIRFWVEHVIQHGGQHLKPVFMDMPLWKVFMLDVLGVLLVIAVVVMCCVVKSARWILRKCCSRTAASPAKKRN